MQTQMTSEGNSPKRGKKTWLAERISDLFSPPVLTGGLAIVLTRLGTPTWTAALSWSSLYVVVGDLVPLAYLLRLLRKGIVSDLHVGVRTERIRPLVVLLVCLGVAFAGAMLLSAPYTLRLFLGLSLVQGIILTAITAIWQISFHAAAVTALIAASGILFGLTTGLILAPLLPLVGWARIHLHRHTFRQVVAGAALSAAIFGPVLAFAL
jgi:hypothetical protein